jgi:DNA polymerase I-like protein with 3'-5' exonuclease and polymerase domains
VSASPPASGKAIRLLSRLATTEQYIRWSPKGTEGKGEWVTVPSALTPDLVQAHLDGKVCLGGYPHADGVAWFGLIDVDLHLDDREPTPDEVATVENYATRKAKELESLGVKCLLIRGHEAGSYHIRFDVAPIADARLGRWLKKFVKDAGEIQVDTYPAPSGGGNAVRLPGRHHKRPDQWSAAWSGFAWEPWPAALDRLLELPKNQSRLFPDPGIPKTERHATSSSDGLRPGDIFNLLVPIEDVLRAHGWHSEREDGERLRFTRPGKDGGISASVKDGTVWVYTSTIPELPPTSESGIPYTSFGFVAHLVFGGDFKKAARELAKNGFCPSLAEPTPTFGGKRVSDVSDVGHRPRRPYVPIPPYSPFPTGCLPEPWATFVRQGAAALKCDESLVALPLLSVLASAIGTTRRVHLGAEWYEPAVLWTCIIQESGGRKSPAAELSVDLVQARQKAQVKEFKAQVEAYKREVTELKKKPEDERGDVPEKPVFKRSIVGDITIEKLASVIDDNRRGLLVYRDELSAWVRSFTRYTKGDTDEANWLSIHRAGPIIYDRKTGDKTCIYVPFGAASVTGGIQPGTLTRLMTPNFFESGLMARILFAMPPRSPKTWTDTGIDKDVKAQANKSLDALYELAPEIDSDGDPRSVVVLLSRSARTRFEKFVNEWGIQQFEAEGAKAAALAKLEALPGRFALIHHCVLRAASLEDSDPIGLESLEAGIALAEWFASEAERVYRMLAETGEDREIRELHELVMRLAAKPEKGGRIAVRDLQRSSGRKYRTKDEATAALERLVGHGLGAWEGDPPTHFRPCPTSDTSDTSDSDDDPDDEDDDPGASDTEADTHPPTDPHPGDGPGTTPEPEDTYGKSPPGRPEGVSDVSDCRTEAEPESSPTEEASAPRSECRTVGATVGHPEFRLITTEAGLSDVVSAIEDGGGLIGLDCETTGLRHQIDRVRLLQLATPLGVLLIDLFAFPDSASLAELFEVLAHAEIVGHNLGFDLPFLMHLGFVPGRVRDTMLASQILHAGERTTRHSLKDVAARTLGITLDKEEQKADWSGRLMPEMLRYAALDAEIPVRIWEKLKKEAEAAGLSGILDIEMNALPCVAWASFHGVGFDRQAWEILAAETEASRDTLREQLDARAPNVDNLLGTRNWDSPDQVKEAFESLRISLESTDDDALANVTHPIAALLREYRGVAKRVGTYGRDWLKHVASDGRVYASWKQLGAASSGRMSCSKPNLQQLPRDPRYRRCFIAPPGRVLVKADYSQIELRIAAKIANEQRMLTAYQKGEDIHTLTARALLNKTDVTKADRQLAKAVNFGLLYGMGAKNLGAYALSNYGVRLTEEEASAHRNTFFRTYPGLRKWHRSMPRVATDTRTLAGRLRRAVTRFTEKLNTPVQGTGADGLKRALALLWERRAVCPDAFPVLFVHDEIVVECDEEQADTAADWLRQCMLDGMAPLIEPVPVEVEVTVGRTWGG